MVPNLTWLSLRNHEYTSLKVGPILDAVKQLHSLKSLSIAIWSTDVVPLKDLYPLFERLEHLLKVRLCPLYGGLKDIGKTLSTLKELKELVLSVYSMDDIEFLRAPSRHQEQHQGQEQDPGWRCDSPSTSSPSSSGDLSAPLLEHLDIQRVSLNSGSQETTTWISELVHHILKTRHRLKYFNLQEFPLCIQDDLVIQGEEEGLVWACKGLETLQLTLSPHGDLGPVLFRAIFWEIGQMKRLKKLSIRYTTLRVDARLEILRVFEDGAKEMKELTLSNRVHYQRWSREEIVKLTTSMPKLRYLNLKPLDCNQYQVIASWLCELGRGEIRLVT
ncbi:hypothetical protein BGX34_003486 [Mortierella sp. NVP85]|nr:hypothetical protein BGX34_003486 [Mortierella sp. NVP85]